MFKGKTHNLKVSPFLGVQTTKINHFNMAGILVVGKSKNGTTAEVMSIPYPIQSGQELYIFKIS